MFRTTKRDKYPFTRLRELRIHLIAYDPSHRMLFANLSNPYVIAWSIPAGPATNFIRVLFSSPNFINRTHS